MFLLSCIILNWLTWQEIYNPSQRTLKMLHLLTQKFHSSNTLEENKQKSNLFKYIYNWAVGKRKKVDSKKYNK